MTVPSGIRRRIEFARINQVALSNAEAVVRGLLPGGRREGREWVALNPRRADAKLGSFKVNLGSGIWKDFASGDGGADLVSLGAFVAAIGQSEAALRLADALGIDPYS